MLNAYEQRLAASYLSNAAARFHYRDPEAAELADWLECRENHQVLPGRGRRRTGRPTYDEEQLTVHEGGVPSRTRCVTSMRSLKGARPDRLGTTAAAARQGDRPDTNRRRDPRTAVAQSVATGHRTYDLGHLLPQPALRRSQPQGTGDVGAARQVGARGAVAFRRRQAAAAFRPGQHRPGRGSRGVAAPAPSCHCARDRPSRREPSVVGHGAAKRSRVAGLPPRRQGPGLPRTGHGRRSGEWRAGW